MLGVAGKQQLLDHVQREQRGHAVIGKALPHLGEGEIASLARVTAGDRAIAPWRSVESRCAIFEGLTGFGGELWKEAGPAAFAAFQSGVPRLRA